MSIGGTRAESLGSDQFFVYLWHSIFEMDLINNKSRGDFNKYSVTPGSVLARICLFSKIGVIFFFKGVICKTRELFFSAKNVPLCAQISRTMPPSKHLRNMRGPYLSTEPLNNKCSSPINCALPPLCATIYYVHIMEHIQHNIRYTYSRNYRAYIPAGHNQ